MTDLLKADLYKLRKSGLIYWMSIYLIVLAFLLPIMLGEFNINGKEALSFSLKFTGLFIIPMAMIFGISITKDFSSGYIKDVVVYGHSRAKIFLSNCIVFSIGVLILSLIFPITFTIINTLKNGYGEAFNSNTIMYMLRIVLLMVLVIFAMGCFAGFLAFIARSNAVLILFIVIVNSISQIGATTTNETIKIIFEYSIFYQLNLISIENISSNEIFQVVIASTITIFLSITIGILIFKKLDIK